jgi:hypothetical protein
MMDTPLRSRIGYQLEPATLDVAKTTKQINLAKQARKIAPQINLEVQAFIV